MQRHTPPVPGSRCFIKQNLNAVRADSSRVNNAAVVHAPQEGIMLKNGPLHACKSCHGCSKRTFDGGPRRCVLASLELRLPDAFSHGGQWHPPVPYRVREGAHGWQESKTKSSSRSAIIGTTVALLRCMRFAKHDAICERDCVSLSPVTATP